MRTTWMFVTCPAVKCGVEFGITEGYYTCRQADKTEFFCPNGHSNKFSDVKPKQTTETKEVKDESLFAFVFGPRR